MRSITARPLELLLLNQGLAGSDRSSARSDKTLKGAAAKKPPGWMERPRSPAPGQKLPKAPCRKAGMGLAEVPGPFPPMGEPAFDGQARLLSDRNEQPFQAC
jgi:hypothetical protein